MKPVLLATAINTLWLSGSNCLDWIAKWLPVPAKDQHCYLGLLATSSPYFLMATVQTDLNLVVESRSSLALTVRIDCGAMRGGHCVR